MYQILLHRPLQIQIVYICYLTPINRLINTQTRYLIVFYTNEIYDYINLLASPKTKK